MTPANPITPALFVSHGAPTTALEDSAFTRALGALGRRLGALRGVVILSAHAEAPGPVRVGSATRYETVHDFGGFPPALHALRYDAPGDPALADEVLALLRAAGVDAALDPSGRLDHGAWVPLRHLRPDATTPVVTLSLPTRRAPQDVLALGRALAPLRARGVLLVGSGGLVHDLRTLAWDEPDAPVAPWAAAFDRWVAERVAAGDEAALLDSRARPDARRAAPTTEHFDPVFFVLGARRAEDRVETLHDELRHSTLSMRTFALDATQEGTLP